MYEVLTLLSKKEYGFRELHRTLPREHRAGSFTTLYACTNLLKSEGYIEKNPETRKLRITTNGASEREKRLVINEIDNAKIVAGYASSSDTSPVRYEWSLAKRLGNIPQDINIVLENFRVDPLKANLLFLSHFLWYLLEDCDNDDSTDQKHTLDDARDRLTNELSVDAEILNIVSIDTRRLLAWLETPSGVATLEYVLGQKREGRIENIARLFKLSFPTQTLTPSPYGYRTAQRKKGDKGNVENGENV